MSIDHTILTGPPVEKVAKSDNPQTTDESIASLKKLVNAFFEDLVATQGWLREVLLTQKALLEHLARAGICDPRAVETLARECTAMLTHPRFAKGLGVTLVRQAPDTSENSDTVDCANRIHLCQAVCCRFRFVLDLPTVEAGKLDYDRVHPFWNACQNQSTVCRYLSNGQCLAYEYRPAICRKYSCKTDRRIWADYEKRIPGEELVGWLKAHETGPLTTDTNPPPHPTSTDN